MVQSATFDRNGVSIDNTELKGKSVSVDCSEFIQEKLTDNTFGERLRKSRLELGLSIPEVADMCNVTKSIISDMNVTDLILLKKYLIYYRLSLIWTIFVWKVIQNLYIILMSFWISLVYGLKKIILLKKMLQVSLVYLVDFLDFGLTVVLLVLVHIIKLNLIYINIT